MTNPTKTSLIYDPRKMEWVEVETGDIVSLEPKKISTPKKIKKTSDQILKENLDHPQYGFCLRLIDHLSSEYGLTHLKQTIFRNRRQSCFSPRSNKIIFGYESVTQCFKTGFREYQTVSYIWGKNGVELSNGFEGLWQLCLHEFAHVLQDMENGARYGSVHNRNFCEKLDELIVLFPFEEIKNI